MRSDNLDNANDTVGLRECKFYFGRIAACDELESSGVISDNLRYQFDRVIELRPRHNTKMSDTISERSDTRVLDHHLRSVQREARHAVPHDTAN